MLPTLFCLLLVIVSGALFTQHVEKFVGFDWDQIDADCWRQFSKKVILYIYIMAWGGLITEIVLYTTNQAIRLFLEANRV